eukprot:COSAG02_NODE_1374_length_13005_cov_5.606152_11_plen_183_part_00
MIRLACGTGLTARRREGQASRGVPATVTDYTSYALVTVIVFSASLTHLDADVCIAARSRGITVVVELSLICAIHRADGTRGAVLADNTVDTAGDAVRVRIRLPSRTWNALTDINGTRVLPVLTCEARCTRCRRAAVAVYLTSHALAARGFAAACVCASAAFYTLGGWVGVTIGSAGCTKLAH